MGRGSCLSEDVIDRLKAKAGLHRRSLKQAPRTILTDAARLSPEEKMAIAETIRADNPGPFRADSVDLIRENRDQ